MAEEDESQQLENIEHGLSSNNGEAKMPVSAREKGGWVTFPFIAGALMGLTLAVAGWGCNFVVYLIEEFHVRSIDATQIFNIAAASTSLLPILGAIIADSFLGCYTVIWVSSLISVMGIILLALTATLHSLRPRPCDIGSSECPPASKIQLAVLFLGITLSSIGPGGTRFNIAAMGANQFNKPDHQRIFFNWFAVVIYTSLLLGATVIVYIEENVSWGLGFCLCIMTNIIGSAIFFSGRCYYRHVKPKGSPFTSLARVVIAAIVKRKVHLSSNAEDYYHGRGEGVEMVASVPGKSLRFLNHAALETEGDTREDGSVAKPWRLCSAQEVEDLKTLLRIFRLLSSSVILCTALPVLNTLTILQALTTNRHLGSHFKVPAGSMIVFILATTAINLFLNDRFLFPLWRTMTGRSPMPLQRIGFGHIFNTTSLAVAALVESKRRRLAQSYLLPDHPGATIPMSVLWLVPQLTLVGLGEAFHYPGQVTLYYQEFPMSLKSTATAMVSLILGMAYYFSSMVIDLVRRVTPWLPNSIDHGRLEYVYWMFSAMGMLNFCYFLICAKNYRNRNLEERNDSFVSEK
ncbi:hypothetical protein SLE2022_353220 [Rubroshorea leprosula]